jgi:hypothetical protein
MTGFRAYPSCHKTEVLCPGACEDKVYLLCSRREDLGHGKAEEASGETQPDVPGSGGQGCCPPVLLPSPLPGPESFPEVI